ncbi:MAG: sigma-70 family RNA polymerase sigma factor [Acidobacteriaceae bacterium]|nr:sigma-70 family RNA polymerase sigma factor [Acidobacteriaceae bacterium]
MIPRQTQLPRKIVAQGSESVTQLLLRWRAGERECLDQLIPLVDADLRSIAHRYMRRERRGHSLQTTALINETYLRLVDQGPVDWKSRAHFIAIAARVMRQVLVDHARKMHTGKRGGGAQLLPLDTALVLSAAKSAELVALDDALSELETFDQRKAQTVELRYFGGMSVEETAEALGVHPNTVIRDWSLARVWLKREMSAGGSHAR